MNFKLVTVKLKADEEGKAGDGFMYHVCTTCDVPAYLFTDYVLINNPKSPFLAPVKRDFNHVYCTKCKALVEITDVEMETEDKGEVTEKELEEVANIKATPQIKSDFLKLVL